MNFVITVKNKTQNVPIMSFSKILKGIQSVLCQFKEEGPIIANFGIIHALNKLDPLSRLLLSFTCKTLRQLKPSNAERDLITRYAADSSKYVIRLVILMKYPVTKYTIMEVINNNDLSRLKLFMNNRYSEQCLLAAAWDAGSAKCTEHLMERTRCNRCAKSQNIEPSYTVSECRDHNRNLPHDIVAMNKSIAKKELSPWTRSDNVERPLAIIVCYYSQ